ncbi:DNA excision repair protein ERCC-5 isoform X2 [Episyrphus balteatus]|uniref:DNA excision repair protein ERCC-5 isoform X2 n=1 Tax=Episyrphus balteatus TaxID=286459 RepID=UPI00248604B6|nr:DNA excision repair protein ERCC-5 isoform X2 [Episyrphus balteatus]
MHRTAKNISIWLHQVVKGFQDNKGSALANSHLLGLFHRLCKLMYYRIKPVFVFDGKVPSLKRETIAKRNQKRNKLNNEAERIQTLLLQSLAKEKVVQQALGSKATEELLKASPSKNKNLQNKRPDIDSIFKLPDMPKNEHAGTETDDDNLEPSCSSESDTSFSESKLRLSNDQNLQAIDVKSKYFRNLPPDIRHEILIDIKETRKQSSWGKLHELPSKSNEFSTFQMKRLLKRRQVQESIEEVEKEMDGVRTFTISELENIFSEEGIIETPGISYTKHISSDANTRYLLVQNLKETLANEATQKINNDKINSPPNESKTKDDICDEDLEKALKMSLDDSAPYSEKDYDYSEGYKLNSEQRAQLKHAAVGLARDFMIEYGGMNSEDIKNLLENTQIISYDEVSSLQDKNHDITAVNDFIKIDTKHIQENIKEIKNLQPTKEPITEDSAKKIQEDTKMLQNQQTPIEPLEVGIISDSDSEMEEVNEINHISNIEISNEPIASNEDSAKKVQENIEMLKNQQTPIEPLEVGIISDSDSEMEEVNDINHISNIEVSEADSKKMEIFVDLSKTANQEEDMFADCFKTIEEKNIEPKPSSLNISDIFQDLKKQASEATKINLSDIKLDATIIEISDDESQRLSQKLVYDNKSDSLNNSLENNVIKEIQKTSKSDSENLSSPVPECSEIIQIVDQDSPQKSSIKLTPSKTKDISSFFETKFIVKRTPEKSEKIEDIPKVKSPFFVRKTPKSSSEKTPRKRSPANNDDSPPKKSLKVNKMLFEKCDDESNSEFKEIVINPQDALECAAKALKENKSTEELEDIASNLAREKLDLEKERNRQDRMGMTITEKMNSECMELLRLFGVPFIVAPMEAEAQCAFLDSINLTNGTITDDSDIWLFGGRTVYKNFFAQNKHVMEFKYEKIKSSFNVDRSKLVQLALLVGSDYTTGINGIGAVTALEILATFSSKDLTEIAASQQASIVLTSLTHFREWWTNTKTNTVIGSSLRHRLRNKLANIELHGEFPSSAVVEAYLNPKVDTSQDAFSWGTPDLESIREFARTNLGWTRHKTDEILGPVLKKLNETKTQSTIKNYFATKSISSTKQMAVSKRVQNAINSMSSDFKPDEEVCKTKKTTRRKKTANAPSVSGQSTDEILEKKDKPARRKNVNIPKSSSTIPQRVKDQADMEQKKKLAAEKFKQSNKKKQSK